MTDEIKDPVPGEEVGAAATESAETAEGHEDGEQKPENPEIKRYSDSDVDRIVAKKIARERERMKKLFEGEQQESELEKRERDVQKRELKADCKDMLVRDGLPYVLADAMNYNDADSLKESYDCITGVVRDAIQQGIKDALRGGTPRGLRGSHSHDNIADAFALKTR